MKSFLISILVIGSFIECNKPVKQTLEADNTQELKAEAVNIQPQEDTTIVTDIALVQSTPYLDKALQYLKKHNKYRDWDANNKKQVMVGFVGEKDGTTSYANIKKSCGVKELDEEALRIVRELKYDEPGTDPDGNPIRVGNMVIMIDFPAK
ncbi:energy transducer TonB [Prevotella sp. 10(H)]|uniref:energy transducer TonB n=1 Tax=Prevotella sp. 10(H) TaxID=1158294 RepID=UPI0004A75304|nr:TonB family protein [Prevotella sp. 10(H)]